MGIFSTISYYTNKALDALGVGSDNNDSKKTDAQSKTKTVTKTVVQKTNSQIVKPVIQTNNVPQNEDKATFSQQAKEKQKESFQNARTRTAIQQSIQNKCVKYGIDGNKLVRELKKHSGMEDGEYEKLSENEKRELWTGIELIFDSSVKQAKARGVSVEASLESVIIETVKNIEKDIKNGNIADVDTILRQADYVKSLLDNSDFQSKSKEEQNKIFNEIHTKWNIHKHEYIASVLSKCPESQRKEKQAELEEIFEKAEMVAFSNVVISEDSETSFRAIRLTSPKNMPNCHKMIGRTRASLADKQNYYDNVATGEATIELYNSYYERGEKPDGAAVRAMNTDLMANKSSEAVYAFQQSYVEARQSGKYSKLEQDGIFTEMAAGNLAGSQLNQNMTVEERTHFVKEFYKSEQQFGDLDAVVEKSNSAIDSYIKENPANEAKLSEEVAEIQQKTQKQLTVSMAKSNAAKHSKDANISPKNSEKSSNSQPSVTSSQLLKSSKEEDVNTNSLLFKQEKPVDEKQIVTTASSESAIQMALASGDVNVEEAVKQSKDPEKVYSVLFSNNNLLAKYEQDAIDYIKECHNDVDKMIEKANCLKAIELIRIHNTADDKEELYAKLEKRATSIQKNLFKKENEEYAAA